MRYGRSVVLEALVYVVQALGAARHGYVFSYTPNTADKSRSLLSEKAADVLKCLTGASSQAVSITGMEGRYFLWWLWRFWYRCFGFCKNRKGALKAGTARSQSLKGSQPVAFRSKARYIILRAGHFALIGRQAHKTGACSCSLHRTDLTSRLRICQFQHAVNSVPTPAMLLRRKDRSW